MAAESGYAYDGYKAANYNVFCSYKYVIEMLDDDFLSLDSHYGSDGEGFWNGRKRALVKAMQNVDFLVCANQHIAEKYAKLGGVNGTYVFKTPMNIQEFVEPILTDEKVKIVYYVNDGTTGMFEKFLRPSLPYISKTIGNKVVFYFMALKPDMSEYNGSLEYHYVPHMSYEEFIQYFKDMQFDVGLAPLDDSEFSRSKYINKYVEYTRGGIAGIYSDCELYRTVIKDGYNGILCRGAGDNWGKAIESLVNNSRLRLSVAKNAQKYAEEYFSEEEVLAEFVKKVPVLTDYKASEHTVSEFRLAFFKLYHKLIFRPCGWINTLYCCVKNGKSAMIPGRLKRRIFKKK